MTQANDPRGTVERLFAAFQDGDLDALIATVHPDSKWTYIGANPKLARAEFSGHEKVRSFFARILSRLDMESFDADEWIVAGDTVVIFGGEAGTVRATGQRFRNEWTQRYTVEGNQITRMVEYNIQVEPRG